MSKCKFCKNKYNPEEKRCGICKLRFDLPEEVEEELNKGVELHNKAMEKNDKGLYQESLQYYRRALKHGEFTHIYYNIGLTLFRKKDYDGAERNFLKAIEVDDPDDRQPHPYFGLCMLYQEKGDDVKAQEALDKVFKVASKLKNVDVLKKKIEQTISKSEDANKLKKKVDRAILKTDDNIEKEKKSVQVPPDIGSYIKQLKEKKDLKTLDLIYQFSLGIREKPVEKNLKVRYGGNIPDVSIVIDTLMKIFDFKEDKNSFRDFLAGEKEILEIVTNLLHEDSKNRIELAKSEDSQMLFLMYKLFNEGTEERIALFAEDLNGIFAATYGHTPERDMMERMIWFGVADYNWWYARKNDHYIIYLPQYSVDLLRSFSDGYEPNIPDTKAYIKSLVKNQKYLRLGVIDAVTYDSVNNKTYTESDFSIKSSLDAMKPGVVTEETYSTSGIIYYKDGTFYTSPVTLKSVRNQLASLSEDLIEHIIESLKDGLGKIKEKSDFAQFDFFKEDVISCTKQGFADVNTEKRLNISVTPWFLKDIEASGCSWALNHSPCLVAFPHQLFPELIRYLNHRPTKNIYLLSYPLDDGKSVYSSGELHPVVEELIQVINGKDKTGKINSKMFPMELESICDFADELHNKEYFKQLANQRDIQLGSRDRKMEIIEKIAKGIGLEEFAKEIGYPSST